MSRNQEARRAALDAASATLQEAFAAYIRHQDPGLWLPYLVALVAEREASARRFGMTLQRAKTIREVTAMMAAELHKTTTLACYPEYEMAYEQ